MRVVDGVKPGLSYASVPFVVSAVAAIGCLLAPDAGGDPQADPAIVAAGRQIAFATERGNCLACHEINGGTQMGNIGPSLRQVRARFPKRQALRARIWDASAFNPNSIMPPFGRHRILTESEIYALVEFLYLQSSPKQRPDR